MSYSSRLFDAWLIVFKMLTSHQTILFWLAFLSTASKSLHHTTPDSGDEALYLTSYIKSGRIKEAQKLAKVVPMVNGVESFSGYLTVNKTYNSNLFFWLIKSQRSHWQNRPLLVWLQGGPGTSSTFGMFMEVGPFYVQERKNQKTQKFRNGYPQRPQTPWREAENEVSEALAKLETSLLETHIKQEPGSQDARMKPNTFAQKARMRPETTSQETCMRPATLSEQTRMRPGTFSQETRLKPDWQELLQGKSSQTRTWPKIHSSLWNGDFELIHRKYSWTRKYNMLFIDNPVGAGFSFTEADSGFAKDIDCATRDLFEALVQLYQLFPALQKNKLILVGQSYGGKFALAAAQQIYRHRERSIVREPSGLVLWSGVSFDSVSFTRYGSLLYNVGLLDQQQLQEFVAKEADIRSLIRADNYTEAIKTLGKEMERIHELTGFKHLLDLTRDTFGSSVDAPIFRFLNQKDVKTALHVGTKNFSTGAKVISHMWRDILRTMRPQFEELLTAQAIPIISFTGQLDIINGHSMVSASFSSLEWPYAKDYHDAKRCQFRVGNRVAAYYKTAGALTEVLVRNTGHLIASVQPRWTLEIMDAFIENRTSLKCL